MIVAWFMGLTGVIAVIGVFYVFSTWEDARLFKRVLARTHSLLNRVPVDESYRTLYGKVSDF